MQKIRKKRLVYFIFCAMFWFTKYRNVVQPGRTLRSGRRSRRFESSHSDQTKKRVGFAQLFFCLNREQGFESPKKEVRLPAQGGRKNAGERSECVSVTKASKRLCNSNEIWHGVSDFRHPSFLPAKGNQIYPIEF